jgi:hypothetical protein
MYKYSNSVLISLQTLLFSNHVRKCFLGKVNFVEIKKSDLGTALDSLENKIAGLTST